MYVFAYAMLLTALLCALGGGGMALLQLWQGRSDHLRLLEKAQWGVAGALFLAAACLLHALFWQDYRVEYVASYTDAILPLFYRLTAFWAGQPGSLLFWGLSAALCGCIFALTRAHAALTPRTRLWYEAFNCAVLAFFCLLLTSWSNPFIMQEPVPADGNGLNPLLQNPGMIFHPPLLFLGYAGFGVPACLALAQLLSGEGAAEGRWFRLTRPFILLSWVLLTAGIVLGAWWAYMELGWGGYWAWDPVENASLLPWLAATAALHILAVENRSGKLGRASAGLMALTVIMAFFATYLTRSGVIQSVHAFGDGGVGTPLSVFVLASLAITLWALWSVGPQGRPLAAPESREGALVLVAWIFLALAAIILVATMWPVLSKLWTSAPRGLDAGFYNRVCLPLGALLLVLLAVCPWLSWSGGTAAPDAGGGSGTDWPRLIMAAGAFVAGAGALWALGYRHPTALVSAAAAIAILVDMGPLFLRRAVRRSPRARSALGAHAGLALLALGVAFSGPYTQEKELLLAKGESGEVGAYTVTLESVADGERPGYDYLMARLAVSRDGKPLGVVAPERRIYAKFGSMQFSEVDVISGPARDIYASLLGMDEDLRVYVKVSIEPLVNWIWIGGALMCLLPLLGLGGGRARTGVAGNDGGKGRA
ncbi:MAG: heme lyase CcmF/NrfE family subunit [Desulfovibrio sp.]|nr:heme lyase CcmF/NrfE family subunit [Desulfovibrio sp.]